MIKTVDDLITFNRDNIEAMTAANQVIAKGLESISKESLAFSSRALEDAVVATKQIGACKTPTEATNLQSKLVKDNWEALVAQSKKITEMTNTVVKDALDPLNARYKAVMNDMVRAAS